MKRSLAAGVAASGALRLDAGKAFAADVPIGAGRSVTLSVKPAYQPRLGENSRDGRGHAKRFWVKGRDVRPRGIRHLHRSASCAAHRESARSSTKRGRQNRLPENGIPARPLRHGSTRFAELDWSSRGWSRDGGARAQRGGEPHPGA